MRYAKSFTGTCPETGKVAPIRLTIEKLPVMGSMTVPEKVVSWACERRMDVGCSAVDDCPVFRRAKSMVEGT